MMVIDLKDQLEVAEDSGSETDDAHAMQVPQQGLLRLIMDAGGRLN